MKPRSAISLAAFVVVTFGHSVYADSATWNGTTDAIWAADTNWSATPIPGTGNTATFDNAGGADDTIDLGLGGVTIGTILFNTANAAAYTLGSGAVGSQTLTLDNGGAITLNASVAANQLINAGLILGNDGSAQTFTLTNASTTNSLTVAGGITGSAGTGLKTLAIAGAGATTLSGIIGNGATGTVALAKADAGTLTLANTGNTFSGGLTIGSSAGTVTAATNGGTNVTGLGSGAVSIGSGSTLNLLSSNTTNTQATINNAFTGAGLLKVTFTDTTATNTALNNIGGFTGTIQLANTGVNGDKLNVSGPGSLASSLIVDSGSQLFVSGGTVNFAGSNGISIIGTGNSENRGAIRMVGAAVLGGNISLAGNSTIGLDHATGSHLTGNISSGVAGTQTLTFGGGASGNGTLSGVLSNGAGTFALTKTNTGTLSLTNANTYTGATTISSTGRLQLGLGGTTGSLSPSSAISVGAGASLVFNRSNAMALGTDFGTITGAGNVAQNGTGTTTFSPSATMGYTGQTQLNRGTLTLDFANIATNNVVSASSVLNLGGGKLSILGRGTGTSQQTFASTTVSPGASVIAPNRGTGTSTTLTLGAVTSGAGSTITFQPNTLWAAGGAGTAGTASTTEIVTVSSVTRPGGALTMPGAGSYAYIGANAFYGSGSATRYVVARGAASAPYQIAGGPSSTAFVTTGGSSSTVYTFSTAQTLTGNTTNYAVIGTGGVTVANAGFTYTSNGFLGTHTGTTTISGTGNVIIGAERDFVVNLTNTGGLTISSVVANNGVNASSVTVSSSGSGVLTLSNAANTYSGGTFINSGTLAIAADLNLGAAPAAAAPGNLTFNGGTLTMAPAAGITLLTNRGTTLGAGGGTFTNTAAQAVSYSGVIAGVGGVTFNATNASGSFNLGGVNTFTGGATLSGAGTVVVQNAAAFGNGGTLTLNGSQLRSSTTAIGAITNPVNIAANTTFPNVTGEQTLTFAGPTVLTGGTRTLNVAVGTSVSGRNVAFTNAISEATVGSGLTKSGTGNLTLSGLNTFTGPTTISAGRLAYTKNFALYANTPASWTAANITVAGGATLALSVGGINEFTSSNVDAIAALGTATNGFLNGSFLGLDTTSGNFTHSSVIANTNGGANSIGLLKLGSNSLTISGTNTYTGTTYIGGGTLVAANTAAFGPAGNIVNTVSQAPQSSGILELATDTSVNAYVISTSSGFASTIVSNRATPGAGITHTLGQLIAGNSVHNITTGTNVISGTAGVSFSGMNLSGGSAGTSTLSPNGTTIAITGPVNIGLNSSAKTLALDGTIAGNSISGNISNGLNTLSLSKNNTSTWTLSGNNSYTGATAINAGTLRAASTTGLSSSSAFTTADVATAVLDLDGYSNTIGSLAGGGAIGGNVTLGAATLTTGGNNSSTSYAGNITGGGNLIKTGTGTFTLASANGYTGTTAVNGGTLLANNTLASSATTVANLATLGGIGTLSGTVTVNSGGTLSAATSTTAGTLTVGGLTLDGGSNLAYEFGATSDLIAVTGANALTINGGILSLYATGGVAPLTTNGTYTLFSYITGFGGSLTNLSVLNSQAGKTYAVNDAGGSITLTLGTAVTTDWNGTASPDITWTNASNWTGSTPNSLGAVANFSSTPTAPTTVSVDGPKTVGSIIFNNSNAYTVSGTASDTITLDNGIAAGAIGVTAGSHAISAPIVLNGPANIVPDAGTTLTLSGQISGAKALSFSGAGTTILEGANSYTGATTISAGTLQIGNGGTTGSLATGSAITNNATLAFKRSDILTQGTDFANGIAGTGAVTQSGSGTTVLNSANTYAGATTVSTGVLNIQHANALGSTAAGTSVSSGAALQIQGGITTAAEALTLNGSGVSTTGALRSLSGNNSYAGAITLGSATTIGTDAGTLTLTGALSGAVALTKTGYGTLVLTNTTAQNATVVDAGTLHIGSQSGASTTASLGATGPVTLNGSSNITFRRTNTSGVDIVGVIGGTGSVTFLGDNVATPAASDYTFNNSNSYSGGTSITGARVALTLADSLGSGTVTLGTNGQVFVNAASLTIANNFSITGLGWNETSGYLGALRLNTTTLTGDITMTGDSRITGIGTSTISGKISGGFDIDFFEDSVLGTITLSGNNDYNGTTTINSGGTSGTPTRPNLIVSHNNALGTTAGGTTVIGTIESGGAGSRLTLANGITVTGETLTLDGNGQRASLFAGVGTTAAWNGNVILTGTGLTALFADGAATNLTVGSSAAHTVTSSTVNLGLRGSTGSGVLNSTLNLGSFGITKTDSGTWTINSNNNDYTGATVINQGSLSAGTLAANGSNSAIGAGTTLVFGQNQSGSNGIGTLQFTGLSGGSTNRLININNGTSGGGGIVENTVSGQTLTLSGDVTAVTPASASTFALTGAGNGVLSGSITGSPNLALTKSGLGTWTVSGSNTHTGVTSFAGGIMNVANLTNYSAAGSLGARSAAQETATGDGIGLVFRGGTLQYTGATAQSTDRQIRIQNGASAATIDASGSVPAATVSFTYSGVNTNLFDTAGTRTLTLTGTNTGDNTFAIRLENQSTNATSLNKSGAGTWAVTGVNTYTGATTVNGGKLKAGIVSVPNVSGAFGNNSAVTMADAVGASLDITGFNTQIGSLTGGGASGGNVILGAATLTVGGDNTTPAAYAGEISGTGGGLTKIGTGTLTLTGANSYTGPTNVVAGMLVVNSSLAATSDVNVANGAKIGGTGTLNAATTFAGIVAPGNSIGTLTTTNNVTWIGGATPSATTDWQFELGLGTSDLLDITGASSDFLKGTGNSFRFDFLNTGVNNGTYTLVDWTGNAELGGGALGTSFQLADFSYTNLDPNPLKTGSFSFNNTSLQFTVIPEPRAAMLGIIGTLALLRRRRSA